jgi:hypothetical protein
VASDASVPPRKIRAAAARYEPVFLDPTTNVVRIIGRIDEEPE